MESSSDSGGHDAPRPGDVASASPFATSGATNCWSVWVLLGLLLIVTYWLLLAGPTFPGAR